MRISAKYPLLFFFLALLCYRSNGQTRVSLFADIEGNDTLTRLLGILQKELNKPGEISIELKKTALYAGKGIYIANISPGKQKVKISPALISAGVEGFAITGDNSTVRILGNSNMALGHGIFTWLETLGYRYYFPHPDWYITPLTVNLFTNISITSSPSFAHRNIFYGYGTGSAKADEDFRFWQLANKMGGSLNAIFGHAYDDIMLRNAQVFKEHPEYFYPVPAKGILPESPKFDMSNEGLVQVVIKDVKKQIETSLKNKTQSYKMITLGPSDGPGTCNSPACQKLGNITDRVFYLINRVAKSIQKEYPDTKIGCLAYSEYIIPPTIRIEPNVYVSVTTAFNNSSYTTEQLIDIWKQKGPMVGVYDYFSWFAWDEDIPGQSTASRPVEIASQIRKYYKKGVKGYDAESSIGWVSKGLGYYEASKLMWDVNANEEKLKKEFFDLCIRKCAGIMKNLWNDWENYGFTQVRESDLARWIDWVSEAEKMETDPKVQKRIYQIKSYLHYLFVFRNYKLSKTEQNLLAVLTYGYRMLDFGSVSGYPAFFELGNRSGIEGMAWGEKAKWRTTAGPVTTSEMNSMLKEDRAKLKVAIPVNKWEIAGQFKTIPLKGSYKNLVADSAQADNAFWLTDEWVVQIKTKGAQNYIEFTGDYIGDKTNIQPIRINVYPFTPGGNLTGLTPIITYDYTAEKVKNKISLQKLAAGMYTILIEDPVKIYRLKFSPSVNYSVVMRPSRQLKTTSLNYAFIYVPENVKRFNVIKSRVIKFTTPTGRLVDLVNDKEEDLQVEVKEGEAGLWRIRLLADRLYIEGIPPFVGTSPGQMLVNENK